MCKHQDAGSAVGQSDIRIQTGHCNYIVRHLSQMESVPADLPNSDLDLLYR